MKIRITKFGEFDDEDNTRGVFTRSELDEDGDALWGVMHPDLRFKNLGISLRKGVIGLSLNIKRIRTDLDNEVESFTMALPFNLNETLLLNGEYYTIHDLNEFRNLLLKLEKE